MIQQSIKVLDYCPTSKKNKFASKGTIYNILEEEDILSHCYTSQDQEP